jgi:hypothetical protein
VSDQLEIGFPQKMGYIAPAAGYPYPLPVYFIDASAQTVNSRCHFKKLKVGRHPAPTPKYAQIYPLCPMTRSTSWAASSGVKWVVSIMTSGHSGASYGSSVPDQDMTIHMDIQDKDFHSDIFIILFILYIHVNIF